ncbi:ubiquinone anaerobic biosynthesis accessory factor UbiT [Brucella sp. IR073]|uniref:ubiquinone anaerobic biosynthesis accessory factor UbiT n=1 Tax=unclassified Brucella TaxID=2632610 RepID=UPI003B9867DB
MLTPLPLRPLELLLQRLVTSVACRKPGLFARLGAQGEKIFLIDPTDLPFVFRLNPARDAPRIEARRRHQCGKWEARIAGPLGALIGLVHGAADGDALFFSRDIVIEGDTEAVLALRNAIDDAELDLVAEAAAMFGMKGGEAIAERLAPVASRLTGLPLTRCDRS